MRVLVTGGAGFIGSHTIDLLLGTGFEAVAVDNLSTGSEKNLNNRAKLYRADICNRTEIEKIFQSEKPDFVFHFAAQTSVLKSIANPQHDMKTNMLGSLNIIESSLKNGVKKIVFASSQAIYGQPEKLPAIESTPANSISPYGVSKKAVEDYLRILCEGKTEYACLRYGNVFGPRQAPQGEAGVVAIFATRMLEGKDVTIFGSGKQTRDFVFVGDAAEANLKALEKGSGAYNIGSGREKSVNELFEKISKLTGYKKTPRHAEKKPCDADRLFIGCGKAERELGWKAETNFEKALEETVEFYRKNAHAEQTHRKNY